MLSGHRHQDARSAVIRIVFALVIGLILFFVCAIYTHIRARDYTPQFGLANGFLLLNIATLVLGLSSSATLLT